MTDDEYIYIYSKERTNEKRIKISTTILLTKPQRRNENNNFYSSAW
jgi:hypothetical protein